MNKIISKIFLYSFIGLLLLAMDWGYMNMTEVQRETMMYYLLMQYN